MSLIRLTSLALSIVLLGSGCASLPPYNYADHGQPIEQPDTLRLRPGEPQVERGTPYWLIDGVGWILGIPMKIILWNSKMANHHISTNTEQALVRYLGTNQLHNVKVRLNEYDPGGEWSRLFRNQSVGAGWRYTFGILNALVYTILPDRLFAGLLSSDNYNPYSNTINIYSDHKAVVIHEAGHAKDFAHRTHKGSYAFCYILPFFALYPEALASSDAISYLRAEGTASEERSAYKVLYPAYCTYIGGDVQSYMWPTSWISLAAVIPGHIVGRIKASTVADRRSEEQAQQEAMHPRN